MNAHWGVVIVAAGRGSRMGTKESKQYLPLHGKPILVHTLELFQSMDEITDIALVVGADDVERCSLLVQEYKLGKVTAVVAGGSERQHSVFAGIKALSPDAKWVMVHDGVRPLVTPKAIRACCQKAEQSGAAVLAVPVKDTIKQVDDTGLIISTPDRRSLWAIQTPQAFRRDLLTEAHQRAGDEQFLGTDDAMVVERMGTPVIIAEGDYTNIKITTPDDLPWAELLLEKRRREEQE
ncbi:2-C-methyl-D-erythritol 4-phosphate cytidylyltransferase [Paenibacillus sp. YAF4_2]|uniref:2-C-methyl-D-erythritol 4-phosphate cytidylyltransferase n=1 Tax=Paenibacillus sp. YAF4_2 TaxID=3233085 RepID=UPI003F9A3B65